MKELERLQKIVKAKRERIAKYKDIEWYAAMDAAYKQVEEEIDERLADYQHLNYFGF